MEHVILYRLPPENRIDFMRADNGMDIVVFRNLDAAVEYAEHSRVLQAVPYQIVELSELQMCERCEELAEALQRIVRWSEMYPTNIFHEPSYEESHRAHKLLTADGMTLDAFSASMGRHCLKGIGNIARGALWATGRKQSGGD